MKSGRRCCGFKEFAIAAFILGGLWVFGKGIQALANPWLEALSKK